MRQLPFYKRLLFWLLLPVLVVGIICSSLLVGYLSSPIESFLVQQYDANLRLSSTLELRACEESFNYLLDLRLENDERMNNVMQQETLEQIRTISQQFPHINYMVVEAEERVKECSIYEEHLKWTGIKLAGKNNTDVFMEIHGEPAKARIQYFPFWDWHIISFVYMTDYNYPVHMAYLATYISSAAVFLALVVTLLIVFYLFISRPLNLLVSATDGVAEGKLKKIHDITCNEFGRVMISFNSMVDSLEHEKSEVHSLIHQLKESEALFRSQFEFGNIGIAIGTFKEGIIKANKRLCEMAECGETELQGYKLREIYHPDDLKEEELFFKRMVDGDIENYAMQMRLYPQKSGKLTFTHLNVSCYRNPDEDIGLVIRSFLDITDRMLAEEEKKQLDAKLFQSQKMEAIGTLAGGVAHDFNNMLGGIIGAADILQLKTADSELSKFVSIILTAANRAADLTKKLLAFSRQQPAASTSFDINTPLTQAVELLKSTADRRINFRLSLSADDELMVVGDPSQLQNAFLNLLINATHAMPNGGDIYISTKVQEVDPHYCEASTFEITPGLFAEVEIKDTGNGIPPETLERIFEPFFTTKQNGEGTGLGLATVLGTVQVHRGAISVYSEVGEGTSFHVLIPLSKECASTLPIESKELINGTGTILIVDDEPLMITTASAILQDLGYETLSANNGKKGLELFKREMDNIDLVILDMIMPEMNGHDCFMEMLKVKPDVRILLSSGFCRDEDILSMKEKGLKGFIHKPFRLTALSQAVHDALIP